MSGGPTDDDDDIAPSFEEQVKFLRKARQAGSTRFQKTTEFNVSKKLRRELSNASLDSAVVDHRLESALNRETNQDIFGESLASALLGKLKAKTAQNFDHSPLTENNQEILAEIPDHDSNIEPSFNNEAFANAELNSDSDEARQSTETEAEQGSAENENSAETNSALRGLFHEGAEFASSDDAEPVSDPVSDDFEFEWSDDEVAQATQLNIVEPDNAGSYVEPGKKEDPASLPFVDSHLEPQDNEISAASLPSSTLTFGVREGMSPEQSQRQLEFSHNYILHVMQFKDETGIDLVLDDKNTINLVLNASGESSTLYAVDFSDSGLEEARTFTRTLVEQYVDVLTTDFGIEFGHPGEVAVRQLELLNDQQLTPGKPLLARIPRIDELKALHRAIEYSWPATYQMEDQLPLQVVFIDDALIEGDDSSVVLKYMEDGRPILFISPMMCQRGRPTDLDPELADDFESWQSSIMREFAWKSAVDCYKFPLKTEEVAALGWVELASMPGFFALTTADGQLFRTNDQAQVVAEAWARCDRNGTFMNASGGLCSEISQAEFLSIEGMASRAKVCPAGENFFNAEEEIVDALRCFRQGAEFRAYLASVSPPLYQTAKLLDQLSINRCYALSASYGGLIRSLRGSLHDNTSSNQHELAQFEREFIKKS